MCDPVNTDPSRKFLKRHPSKNTVLRVTITIAQVGPEDMLSFRVKSPVQSHREPLSLPNKIEKPNMSKPVNTDTQSKFLKRPPLKKYG